MVKTPTWQNTLAKFGWIDAYQPADQFADLAQGAAGAHRHRAQGFRPRELTPGSLPRHSPGRIAVADTLMMRSKLFVPGSRPELFAKAAGRRRRRASRSTSKMRSQESRKAEARAAVGGLPPLDAAAPSAGKVIIVRVNGLGDRALRGRPGGRRVAGPRSAQPARGGSRQTTVLRRRRRSTGWRASGHRAAHRHPRQHRDRRKGLRRAAEIAAARSPRRRTADRLRATCSSPTASTARTPRRSTRSSSRCALPPAKPASGPMMRALRRGEGPGRFHARSARPPAASAIVGKSCIHPSQIALANEASGPSRRGDRVGARASWRPRRRPKAKGVGAFLVDGRMIDAPFMPARAPCWHSPDGSACRRNAPGSRAMTTLISATTSPRRKGTLDGRARARPLAPRRRQRAHPDPRRLRRRGDQGRAAGGRHPARLAHRRTSQTHWKIYARNKKSLGLELRKPEARELLLRLVPSAAMFVESFRPGTLEKMGLGARDAAGAQPEARHRAHLRLRPGRALPPAARLRHADRGHVGLRRDQRLRRPRAGAAADVSRRRRRRPLRRLRGDDRAARGRAERRARAR